MAEQQAEILGIRDRDGLDPRRRRYFPDEGSDVVGQIAGTAELPIDQPQARPALRSGAGDSETVLPANVTVNQSVFDPVRGEHIELGAKWRDALDGPGELNGGGAEPA